MVLVHGTHASIARHLSANHLFAARAAVPHTPSGAVVNRSMGYSGAIGEM
jgi:hypothetical protein